MFIQVVYQTSHSQTFPFLKEDFPIHYIDSKEEVSIDTSSLLKHLHEKDEKGVVSKGYSGGTFNYLHVGHKVTSFRVADTVYLIIRIDVPF